MDRVLKVFGLQRIEKQQTIRPWEITQNSTVTAPSKLEQRKHEDCKHEYYQGGIIATNERPYCNNQKAQSFINSAIRNAERAEEEHYKEFNARLEDIQKQAGAYIKKLKDMAKSAQDHWQYLSYPRKDFQSFTKDTKALAHEENEKNRLMNEGYALVAQHIIEQIAPLSFADTEECRKYRDLILKGSEDENKIQRLYKELSRYRVKRSSEAIQDQSEAHIIIDNIDKGCGSVNGVYMEFKELKSIKPKDDRSALIEFRDDITEIMVQDEHGEYRPWIKRFAEGEYKSNSGLIKIEVPGTKCNGKERTELIAHFYDDKGNKVKTETISTKDLRKIIIKRNDKNRGDIEWTIDKELKTMPDGNISLQKHKHPYNKLQNAFRINLKKGILIMPDGQYTIPINMLDLTETKVDKDNGLILRTDKEWRSIPLKVLADLNTHYNAIKELQSEAVNLASKMESDMLQLLQEARHTKDKTKIAEAFAWLDSTKANLATDKASLVAPLKHVPENEDKLALTREQARNQFQRDVYDNHVSVKELSNTYNNEERSLIESKLLTDDFVKMIKENNGKLADGKMGEMLNDIYEKFGFDNKDEYEKMIEQTKEYEGYISKTKGLTEDDKKYIIKYTEELNSAIENIADQNTEEQDIIRKYAKAYVDKIETITGLNPEQQDIIQQHAKAYVDAEDAATERITNLNAEEKNLVRQYARSYIDAQNIASAGIDAESTAETKLTEKQKNLIRQHAASCIKGANNVISNLPEVDQKRIIENVHHIDNIKGAEKIEDTVDKQNNVYLNNEIYLIKASNSANSREVIKVLEKLDEVDYIDKPKELKGQRQTSENIMVKHLRDAVAKAAGTGNPDLIWKPLHQVTLIRQRRLNNLEHVKNALNPQNSKDQFIGHIKKIVDQPSLKVSELREDFYNKKANDIEAKLDKLIEDGLKEKNPAEYQKKAVELINQTATLAYQHLLEAFAHDPDALRDFQSRRVDIYFRISDQASTAFNTALRLRYFEQQKGLLNWMMWQEIYVMTLSGGATRLTQFEARIGNVFHRCMSEIFNTGI